ncbi:hypothetical protein [Nonomuraea basaltis]|uniref:hypothetical protein n=1 Tax=Nonomuraea basaltis TaxID=2495887 RepID=UPI00110C4EF2|nr:hypothetical protein [Nonomuraea basaltis]TMR92811.1 hypothetical protein EJK15_42410 [Nonomuraea basaltis]
MKYVAAATRGYRLELRGHDWFEPQTTTDRAWVLNSIRVARLAGLPLVVALLTPEVEYLPACSWCRARPRAVEQDCDGVYVTATCDAPQCVEARRLAYEGVIAYPSHQRSDNALRIVQPVRVRRADGPRPGVVTVDEYDDITCLCGNVPSNAGFHPCFPGGALIELDDPKFAEWDSLYWCAGVGCPGVIVDCRYIDDTRPGESVTDAFPVEIHDECGDCPAHKDAPREDHSYACSANWT